MKKDPKIFLEHILESIEEIEKYSRKLTKEEFKKTTIVQDAIIRRIEMIGEAVKNLPPELTKKYHKIPWREVAGMRDILIHEYFGVNTNIVWNTVKKDLPKLKEQVEKIVEKLL